MTGGEHYVKIAGSQLKWFGVYGVVKGLLTKLIINDGGVCRTAPATLVQSVANIRILEYICKYSLQIIFIFLFAVKTKL